MDNPLSDNDVPTVNLKKPLDINSLLRGEGSTFEINFDDFTDPDDIQRSYAPEQLIDICSVDAISVGDDDNYESSPFSYLETQMENLDERGYVKKRIVREGYGVVVPENALVTIDYNAYLEYNGEPFDSTYARKRPLVFRVNNGETLVGLDIGVQSMKLTEKAQFLIRAEFAYGKMGCLERVPPDSTVLFEVELKKMVNSGAATTYDQLSQEEKNDFKNTYNYAQSLCAQGNDFFSTRKDYKSAVRQYNMAVTALQKCHLADYQEQEQRDILLLRLYTNLAVAYCKLEQARKCCNSCNEIYHICKGTDLKVPAKVFYNNAKALIMLNDLEMAEKRLRQAANIKRDDPDIVKCFLKLNDLKEQRAKREAKMISALTSSRTSSEVNDEFLTLIEELCLDLKKDKQPIDLPSDLSEKQIECVKKIAKQHQVQLESTEKDGKKVNLMRI